MVEPLRVSPVLLLYRFRSGIGGLYENPYDFQL